MAQSPLAATAAYLFNVRASSPERPEWLLWLWSGFGILSASIALVELIPEMIAHVVPWLASLCFITHALQVIVVGAWIAWKQPWHPTTLTEQRLGRMTAIIGGVLLIPTIGSSTLDPDLWGSLWFYIMLVVLLLQIIWLSRHGVIRLAAIILTVNLVIYTLGLAATDSTLTQFRTALVCGIIILVGGFLVKWWFGLVIAIGLPLLITILASLGITSSPPNWAATLVYVLVLSAYAGIIALYTNALKTALTIAETTAAELVTQHNMVAQKNEELRRSLQAAHSANNVKSQFVATISHELRTPLTAVLGYTQMLQTGIYGDMHAQQQDALARIHTSSEHLLELIDDLLDFSKLEAGQQVIHSDDLVLADLIVEVVSACAPQAKARRLMLRSNLDPALPQVIRGDRRGLHQILLNLLSNAIKFTDQGTVALWITAAGSYRPAVTQAPPAPTHLVIKVEDTGIGIAADDQAHIFEPFRRVDTSLTNARSGTGLGLAITKHLVTLMGGAISVSSVPGQGSCFTVTLPLIVATNDTHSTAAHQAGLD